jgi:RHS repeat-associated protein
MKFMLSNIRWSHMLVILVVGALIGTAIRLTAQGTSSEPTADTPDCATVQALMDADRTPFDYGIHGGALDFKSGTKAEQSSELKPDDWADYWYLSNSAEDGKLSLAFDQTDANARLEYAVFEGVSYLNTDHQFKFLSDKPSDSYSVRPGTYTIVVRRAYLHEAETLSYKLQATLTPAYDSANPITPFQGAPSNIVDGRLRVRFNAGAQAYVNVGALDSGASIADAAQSQALYFGKNRDRQITIPASAVVHASGGSLGAYWSSEFGSSTLYIDGFDFTDAKNIQSLNRVGQLLNTDGKDVAGVWLLRGCIGFKLRGIGNSGNRFVAPIQAGDERRLAIYTSPGQVSGSKASLNCRDAIAIVLDAPGPDNLTEEHNFCLSVAGIRPGATLTLDKGVLNVPLEGERSIELQTNYISQFQRNFPDVSGGLTDYGKAFFLRKTQPPAYSIPDYQPRNEHDPRINAPLTVVLRDADKQKVTLKLDWIHVQTFSFTAANTENELAPADCKPDTPQIRITFTKEEQIRKSLARCGDQLLQLESLDDVIQITYRGDEEDQFKYGEERLLLPASETFIELITPGGKTPQFSQREFDGTALPGNPGYSPRASNNLGGECYPYPGLHPEANCAPNGQPNPANGNLWYSVVDHSARGYLLNLALSRSYNSADAKLDGPFGQGWTTDFLIDYNVAYQAETGSRVIDVSNADNYGVSLNLIYAPRGVISFRAPSGSRHVFIRDERQQADFYRSLTMPGWVIFRSNVRNKWQLMQESGFEMDFDRAGRMIGYGYPDQKRWVSIQIIANLESRINGPGKYGADQFVRIADNGDRQLELYFNSDGRIYRSVLRDFTQLPDFRLACNLGDNCFETLYQYENNQLTRVIYPNRQTATYGYDGGLLTQVDDPRAPVARRLAYAYASGRVTNARICETSDPASCKAWLTFHYDQDRKDTEVTTAVTDEYRQVKQYTYSLDTGVWNKAGKSYRLMRIDAGVSALQQEYTWSDLSQGIRQIVLRAGKDTLRKVEFSYENFDASGVIGSPGVLTKILDQNIVRFDIARVFDFNGNRRLDVGDYYTDTPDIYYEQPRTVKNEDGTVTILNYRPSPSGGYLYPNRVDMKGGAEGIYIISRYQDAKKANWIQSVQRYRQQGNLVNDLLQFYDYNAVGLTTVFLQKRPEDPDTDRYTVIYRYDGIGQVTSVNDSELGTYRIEYNNFECPVENTPETAERKPKPCRVITVTDPQDGVQTYSYDGRNRLIEKGLREGANGPYLRRETYTYDYRDRLKEQTEGDCKTQPAVCLTTSYQYDTGETGPIITRTDPAGGAIELKYDALGRLIHSQILSVKVDGVAARGLETEYSYQPSTSGWRVTQTVKYARPFTTVYSLDASLRLTGMTDAPDSSGELNWAFSYNPNNNHLQQIQFGRGFSTTNFRYDANTGRLASMDMSTLSLTLGGGSEYSQDPIHLGSRFDSLGQMQILEDGEGSSIQITRCTLPRGAARIIYLRQGSSTIAPDCKLFEKGNNKGVDTIEDYDIHGRLIKITDEFGIREFSYKADTRRSHRWNVTITAYKPDTPQNKVQWEEIYNLAGDLVEATDVNGVQQFYTYDTAGRLIRVAHNDPNLVPQQAFTYNGRNQLEKVRDEFGNQTIYNYDEFGRLKSRKTQQANPYTSEVVSYEYPDDLMVVQKYSAADSEREYSYQFDPDYPERLQSIKDPAGVVHTFTWKDTKNFRNHQLVYTMPGGREIAYGFNALGELTVARDATRIYQWQYNRAGNLKAVIAPFANGRNPNSQQLNLYYSLTLNNANSIQIAAQDNGHYIWRETIERSPYGLPAASRILEGMTFSYDPIGRLNTLRTLNSSGIQRYAWDIRYAKQGLEFSHSEDQTRMNFAVGFDSLYQLRKIAPESAAGLIELRSQNPFASDKNKTLTVNQDGRTLVYTFDRGQTTVKSPGVQEIYTFNPLGAITRLERQTCTGANNTLGCPADAPVTSYGYAYDAAGRLTCVDYEAKSPAQYCNDAGRYETFEYDRDGSLTHYRVIDGPVSRDYTYVYEAGRLIRLKTSSGDKSANGPILLFQYERSNDGKITNQRADRVVEICWAERDEQNYEDCKKTGGILESYQYDALGRLTIRNRAGFGRDVTIPKDNPKLIEVKKGSSSPVTAVSSYNPYGLVVRNGNRATVRYTDDGLNLPQVYTVGTSDCRREYTYQYQNLTGLIYWMGLPQLTGIRSQATASAGNCPEGRSVGYTYFASGLWQGRVQTMRVGEHVYDFAYQPDGSFSVSDAQHQLSVSILPSSQPPALNFEDAAFNPDKQTYTVQHTYGDTTVTADYNAADYHLQGYTVAGGASPYKATTGAPVYDEREQQITITETRQTTNQTISIISYYQPNELTKAARWTPLLLLTKQVIQVGTVDPKVFQTDGKGKTYFPNQHEFWYSYDANGNLSAIYYRGPNSTEFMDAQQKQFQLVTRQCFKYTYDDANRLTNVDAYDANNQSKPLASYRYDAQNRLEGFDDGREFVYLNGEQQARFVYFPDGKAAKQDNLFTAIGAPVNGFFGLMELGVNPTAAPDPCALIQGSAQDDMKSQGVPYDQQTGLMFLDGRAYLPQIGRFLQADPRGMDALGNLYTYPNHVITPPDASHPDITQGLELYAAALAQQPARMIETSDTLKQRYIPANRPSQSAITRLLSAHQQFVQTLITNQMNIPDWLALDGNQSRPTISSGTGLYGWNVHLAVLQGDAPPFENTGLHSNFWNRTPFANSVVASPETQFQAFLSDPFGVYRTPRFYLPQFWQAPSGLAYGAPVLPAMSPFPQMRAMFSLPWSKLDQQLVTVQLAEVIQNEFRRSGLDRVTGELIAALPKRPEPDYVKPGWKRWAASG